MHKIILNESQKKTLRECAKRESPNEACAILFGSIEGTSTTVKKIALAENTEHSPVNFTISNEQLIKIYQMAEDKKMDVVGIFHSHPSSEAVPSNTDKKFMESNPVVWLIFSGISEEFRAFVLESEITEVQVQVSQISE